MQAPSRPRKSSSNAYASTSVLFFASFAYALIQTTNIQNTPQTDRSIPPTQNTVFLAEYPAKHPSSNSTKKLFSSKNFLNSKKNSCAFVQFVDKIFHELHQFHKKLFSSKNFLKSKKNSCTFVQFVDKIIHKLHQFHKKIIFF